MNNIKKIVYVVALFNSCIPVPLVALPHDTSVIPLSKFHGDQSKGVSSFPTTYRLGNPKMAPYVVTFEPGKFTERVSSTWSAIPIEIKVASGFLALFGITSTYYRLKRWWYSTNSEKKKSEQGPTAEEDLLDKKPISGSPRMRARSVSGDSSSSGGSLPSLESERRSSADSSSSTQSLHSLSGNERPFYPRDLSDSSDIDDEKEPEPCEKIKEMAEPVVPSDEENGTRSTSWFSQLASWVSSFWTVQERQVGKNESVLPLVTEPKVDISREPFDRPQNSGLNGHSRPAGDSSFEALFSGSAVLAEAEQRENASGSKLRRELNPVLHETRRGVPLYSPDPSFRPGSDEEKCLGRIKDFFRAQGVEKLGAVMDTSWSQELVSSMLRRLNTCKKYDNATDISTCSEEDFGQMVRNIVATGWSSEQREKFRFRRNELLMSQFRGKKSDANIASIGSALSRAHADFSTFVDDNADGDIGLPAIVRVEVPEQTSAECGAWALVNLFAMNQSDQEANALDFNVRSKSLFDAHFTNGPEDQMLLPKDLKKKSLKMGFGNCITVLVDERQGGSIPDFYEVRLPKNNIEFHSLSNHIKDNLKQKTPTNILLQTSIECGGCDHSVHWSAVSVVYTDDMQEPVVLLMDSLKGDAELKTKDIVKGALCQIAEMVRVAMENQSSIAFVGDEPSPVLLS